MRSIAVAAFILLAFSACGPAEPESTANKATRLEREIAEREKALNAQVENELSQIEQRLEAEASQALNSLNAAAANLADEAAPVAAENKAR